jgi:hypothetical protein
MADFTIGPSVLQALQAADDEPRSDETYYYDARGQVAYSLTQGRDAIYRWTPQDGTKRLPFDVA